MADGIVFLVRLVCQYIVVVAHATLSLRLQVSSKAHADALCLVGLLDVEVQEVVTDAASAPHVLPLLVVGLEM